MSWDDDEDSSPLVQDLDLADHVPCLTRDMTTSGHDEPTLTHSLGASAHGSEIPIAQNAKLTGNNRKVTPASPRLTAASEKAEEENAKLTGSTGRLSKHWQPQYSEGRSTQERCNSDFGKFHFSHENVHISQSAMPSINDYKTERSSNGFVKEKNQSAGPEFL